MNEESTETTETEEEQKFRLRTIISDQDVMELRSVSEPVAFAVIDSGEVCLDKDTQELIQALKDYVIEHDGLGVAGVQLGVKKRVFVMRQPFSTDNLLVVINPTILRGEGHSVKGEGCFSIPDSPGVAMVRRFSMIDVSYTDESGETHENEKLVGMDARVFQHELDHLDGILMIDAKPNGRGFQSWRRLS